ncbi:tRNA isopentenyl-2-thiomethyl-A-37 hydroxylase MiaE [Agarivorans sp. MS3-6]
MQSSEVRSLLTPIYQFLNVRTPETWVEQALRPENLTTLLCDHANAEWKAAATAVKLLSKYAASPHNNVANELKQLLAPYEFIIFRAGKWSADVFVNWFFPNGISAATNEQASIAMSALDLLERCKLAPLLISQVNRQLANLPCFPITEHLSALRLNAELNQSTAFNQQLLEKMRLLIKEELHHFEQVFSIMHSLGLEYRNLHAGHYAKGLIARVRHYEPQALVDKLIVGAFIEARSCERFAALAPHLPASLAKFYNSLLRSEARHYQDYILLASQLSEPELLQQRVSEFAAYEAELIMQPSAEFRFHSGVPIN